MKLPRLVLPLVAAIAFLIPAQTYAQTGERFEISALKAVRPALVRMVAACDKGDIAAAKAAYEDYVTGWKGVQIYVVMRDHNVFQFEGNIEVKIVTAFKSSQPNMAALSADVKTLLARYDVFIATVAKQPPLNPLFDDVARLRIARAEMREVDLAIRANDFAKARASLAVFTGKMVVLRDILMVRAPETWEGLAKGVPRLQGELASAKPDPNKCLGYIREMMSKYSRTLSQLTQQAGQPAE